MFKVIQNPEFTHDVDVMTPVDGGHEKSSFKARFKVVPKDDADKFDLLKDDGLCDFLKVAIVSLSDLVGEDDKALPYNDALRDQLLGLPYVALALYQTYSRAVTKAQMGN